MGTTSIGLTDIRCGHRGKRDLKGASSQKEPPRTGTLFCPRPLGVMPRKINSV